MALSGGPVREGVVKGGATSHRPNERFRYNPCSERGREGGREGGRERVRERENVTMSVVR